MSLKGHFQTYEQRLRFLLCRRDRVRRHRWACSHQCLGQPRKFLLRAVTPQLAGERF